ARPHPWHYARGEGRWVTIGAKEGADGKKHGGSPVFIEGGRITKGHPSLTGKRIGALGEEAEAGTHRQHLHRSREYARAAPAKLARKEGVPPEDLHSLAAEILAHDRAFKVDVTRALRRARQLSEGLGYGSLDHLRRKAATGADADAFRGLDDVAER